MPLFLITANCHVLDVNLFEQFFILLHPWLTSHDKFAYSVEEDDTLNRHLHFIVDDNAADCLAMYKKFNTKTFKLFRQNMPSTNTIWKSFLHITKVKKSKEDLLKTLGYILKDNNKRRGFKGFTEPFILSATKFYFVTEHLDKSILKKDEVLINSKNIFGHVKDFVKTNNLSFADPCIQYMMIQQNYSFLNIQPKQIKRAFNEMSVMSGDTDPKFKNIICNEQKGFEHQNHWDLEDNIKLLLEELESHIHPDEIPSKIKFLYKQYYEQKSS